MPSPRSTISMLPPAIHGARDYAELQQLGLHPDDIIDFSTNSNPFGPHPAVLQAVQEAVSRSTLARYPDRDCLALRAAIAAADNIPPDNILPGNGATELIHLIALTFVQPDTCHLVISPTFGEYARAIRLLGGNVYEHYPQTFGNLRLGAAEVATIVRRLQPETVWLCNPNNPTGQYWTPSELAHLFAADPQHKILWIIDEAYRQFVDRKHSHNLEWPDGPNVIRLRSLTKDYSLAGLRLGYLVADLGLIRPLQTAKPAWSVNSLAQIAGVAALQPDVITWQKESLTRLHTHATDLWRNLSELGWPVSPTTTTFTLVNVAQPAKFRRYLLRQGLLVRDCTSFGLPHHIRIAAHRPESNEKLLAVLKNFQNNR